MRVQVAAPSLTLRACASASAPLELRSRRRDLLPHPHPLLLSALTALRALDRHSGISHPDPRLPAYAPVSGGAPLAEGWALLTGQSLPTRIPASGASILSSASPSSLLPFQQAQVSPTFLKKISDTLII